MGRARESSMAAEPMPDETGTYIYPSEADEIEDLDATAALEMPVDELGITELLEEE